LAAYPQQVGITIRFSIDAQKRQNKRTIVAERILNAWLAERADIPDREDPVTHWFKYMNIDKFNDRYPPDQISGKFRDTLLRQHQQWCDAAAITHTPAIFVNGYPLPGLYRIDDLRWLVPVVESLNIQN